MDQSTIYFIYFLAAIGGIWFVIAISGCAWTLLRLLLPRKDFIYNYGSNSWAIITGGSDGIGLAFAKQLAKEKFNICLIARNPKKLSDSQNQIRQLCPEITTKVIVADFNNSQQQGFFERIGEQLRLLDVSILINNAGMATISEFQNIAMDRIKQQINVNCVPYSCMASLVIPNMLKRQQRSAIVMISSTASVTPCPYTSNYSGTKAYGSQLSRGLQLELQDKIDFLCVEPMVVETNLSGQSNRWDIISPQQCARSSLNLLGYDTMTQGHWKHRFVYWLVSHLPQVIVNYSAKKALGKLVFQKEKSNVRASE